MWCYATPYMTLAACFAGLSAQHWRPFPLFIVEFILQLSIYGIPWNPRCVVKDRCRILPHGGRGDFMKDKVQRETFWVNAAIVGSVGIKKSYRRHPAKG